MGLGPTHKVYLGQLPWTRMVLASTSAPWPAEAEEAYARLEPALLPILEENFSDVARTVLLHECPCGVHSLVVAADQAVNDAIAASQDLEDPQGAVESALSALGHKLHYEIERGRGRGGVDWTALADSISAEARSKRLDLRLTCFAEVHMPNSDVVVWLALPARITAPFREAL